MDGRFPRGVLGGVGARAAGLGANMAEVMVWWPGLAVLWWAVVPNAGVGSVAGIGLGLALLGLADTAAQMWGLRRRARSAPATELGSGPAERLGQAAATTPIAG